MAKERLPFHELANIFPLMSGAPFDALVADIEAHGLREPIVKHKGQIVDGRNRYNACLKAKREPSFVEWDEQGTLISFIVSANLHRRHLDESQRAMVAAKMANLGHGQKKSDTQICVSGISQADAAELVNVSHRLVSSAAKVLESSPKDVIKATESGEIKASDAANVADLPKADQSAALRAVEKESAATLTEAAVIAKLDRAVADSLKAKEITLAAAKKLAALPKIDQVLELKKIRAKAALPRSTQVVAGRATARAPSPPRSDKPSGKFSASLKALQKLSRTVNDDAEAAGISIQSNAIRAIHTAITQTNNRILEANRK